MDLWMLQRKTAAKDSSLAKTSIVVVSGGLPCDLSL